MPRLLSTVLIAAFLLYGAYWFIGKSTREDGLERWFDERAAAGWVADTEINLRGFPNRYDAVMTDLNLADPNSFRNALFAAIDITRNRKSYFEMRENALVPRDKRGEIVEEGDPAEFEKEGNIE